MDVGLTFTVTPTMDRVRISHCATSLRESWLLDQPAGHAEDEATGERSARSRVKAEAVAETPVVSLLSSGRIPTAPVAVLHESVPVVLGLRKFFGWRLVDGVSAAQWSALRAEVVGVGHRSLRASEAPGSQCQGARSRICVQPSDRRCCHTFPGTRRIASHTTPSNAAGAGPSAVTWYPPIPSGRSSSRWLPCAWRLSCSNRAHACA